MTVKKIAKKPYWLWKIFRFQELTLYSILLEAQLRENLLELLHLLLMIASKETLIFAEN
jgi:hypothetical protein